MSTSGDSFSSSVAANTPPGGAPGVTARGQGSQGAIASLYRPFGIHWLDSALQETLLPGAPWHKLSGEIEAGWALRLEAVMEQPEKRQMLFEIAGPLFVARHFSHLPNEPMILEEPQMVSRIRKALRADALSFMNSQLQATVSEMRLLSPKTPPNDHSSLSSAPPSNAEKPSTAAGSSSNPNSNSDSTQPSAASAAAALDEFVKDTRERFHTALDRHLLLGDQTSEDLIDEKEATTHRPTGRNEPDTNAGQLESPDLSSGRIAGNRQEGNRTEQKQHKAATATRNASNHQRVFLKPETKKPFAQSFPGNCWSPESEVLGLSVRSILERDPSRLQQICRKLHGRFLPSTLRSYLWVEVLFQKQLKGPSLKSRRALREQFSRAISRGLVELQIKSPTKTPINGLIENAVVEMYDKTASMQAYNSVPHMRETVGVLNITYCLNRSYEAYWVYWLYPLQISMAATDHQSHEEHPLNLSMYLEMLVGSCYFKWPEIFRMSQNVLKRVQSADSNFYNHLMQASVKDTENLQIKDFITGLMKLEECRSKQQTQNDKQPPPNSDVIDTSSPDRPGSSESTSSSYLGGNLTKGDLCNPVIFVRKWIGEGFVSVLDSQAVLLLWDQLMMSQWDSVAMEHFAVAIIFLLREPLMDAQNYFEIKHVLLNLPCELHTRNVLFAYKHLHNNGNPSQIPDIIRRLDL